MVTEAKVNEIFTSIQGEGPYVGYKQLFIRFCGCNLNCNYCDTEFSDGKIYTPNELYKTVENILPKVHSVSLTGGEPLLAANFLKEFLPLIKGKTKIYLETNATLVKKFSIIKPFVDIVSADIKLSSATGKNTLVIHREFLKNCVGVETFAKIVFDENITEEEIIQCCNIGKECNVELILQPKMSGNKMAVSSEFCTTVLDKFLSLYSNVRVIPQTHKFLGVE